MKIENIFLQFFIEIKKILYTEVEEEEAEEISVQQDRDSVP